MSVPAASSVVHVRASELRHLALDARRGTLLVCGQVVICEVTLKRSHRLDKVVVASSSDIGQSTVKLAFQGSAALGMQRFSSDA